jgi:hypothetical protein
MTYPAVIFWPLFVWSLYSSPATVLTLLLSSLSFGSLAVVPPEVTGGVTLLPASMFAIALFLKVMGGPLVSLSPSLFAIARLRTLGYLLAFLAVAIVTTILMPRLFWGAVSIVPMRNGTYLNTELLEPGQANITQTAYLTLSVAIAFSTTLLARSPQFPHQLLVAVLIGGATTVATGLLDMAVSSVGLADLLEPFRNASYSMLTNTEVLGVRRVVGLMPEASSYGALCGSFASALLFLRPLYPAGRMRFAATIIALAILGLTALSTSSTAYIGLAIMGAAYLVNWTRRLVRPSAIARGGLGREFVVMFIMATAFLLAWIIRDEIFDPVIDIVNEMIFNKAKSASYFERSFWNTMGWNALQSTYGLGVGLGSTRTSNWLIAVISNAGILGAALLGIFLLKTYFRRSASGTPVSVEMLTALKFAMIPSFAMATLASTSPDIGPWLAVILGAITGLATPATTSYGSTAIDRRAGFRARPGLRRRAEQPM